MNTQAATDSMAMKRVRKRKYIALLEWILPAVIAILSVGALQPPRPVSANAWAESFSAERALAHVRIIAAEPHPIGSAANAAVRKYLVEQLSALSLDPQIFSGIGVNQGDRGANIGYTQDIVGRLRGTANSRAILLMAHYDSVDSAPGAADDGAGVAAILESLRALRAGPALKNDLIVLFTDGEEAGLLGAEAFVSAHPWMNDVGLVMNFEARGNKGPSLLFETGANNEILIKTVAHAASAPMGSSLFYSLYKLLPNDTDYTVFRHANVPGLNFAFGEGLDAYHTRLDTPDHLSPASLQHHGSYIMDLTRRFGQMDLTHLKDRRGDAVFFDWFGGHFISYPETWVIPGEILVTLLLLCVMALALWRKQARGTRILIAGLYGLIMLVAIPVTAGVVQWLVSLALGSRQIEADATANTLLLSGLVFAGCCIGNLLFSIARKRCSVKELSLGGLSIVCILSWLAALAFPAGSYLLFWPLLVMTLGLLGAALKTKAPVMTLAGFLGMAATLLLFAPIAYLIYVFLTLNVITAAATGVLIGIFFLLCFPFVHMAVPEGSWRGGVAGMLAPAIICLAAGSLLSHPSPQHPRRDSILYGLNADSGKAAWISFDPSPDAWTSQFFSKQTPEHSPMPDYLGGFSQAVLSAPAPQQGLSAPAAEILESRVQGGTRTISLKITSPRRASTVLLRMEKGGIASISLDGRTIKPDSSSGLQSLRLFGMGAEGAKLDLTFQTTGQISFWLLDGSYGLPMKTSPPPDDVIGGGEVTVVCRKYRL